MPLADFPVEAAWEAWGAVHCYAHEDHGDTGMRDCNNAWDKSLSDNNALQLPALARHCVAQSRRGGEWGAFMAARTTRTGAMRSAKSGTTRGQYGSCAADMPANSRPGGRSQTLLACTFRGQDMRIDKYIVGLHNDSDNRS